MRVSTGMIYDAGLASIQRRTSDLLQVQQQMSTGRRVLTPADDPVAAARALEVEQSQSINSQHLENQKAAGETLGLVENGLTTAGQLLDRVRQLAVQAGGGALSDSDRRSIAAELRGLFEQFQGVANSRDGSGQYLFAGFKGDTQAFTGNIATGVSYAGDEGQRLLQISASRQLPVTEAGSTVFMNVRQGNGYFTTDYTAGNTGTGVIDAGSIADPGTPLPETYTITFTVTGTTTTYDVTGSTSGLIVDDAAYSAGDGMALTNLAATTTYATVTVKGEPADTDSFTVAPASTQSVFATIENLVEAVENSVYNGASAAKLANEIGFALSNINQVQDNLLRVRATVGARMGEIDTQANASEDLDLQYESSLSRLRDVDYTAAITRLTQQQVYLEAAQKSFVQVTSLSLFDFV